VQLLQKTWTLGTRLQEKNLDLQLKEQTKETISVAKQTFSATTNVLVNKTWYIDLKASQHFMFQKNIFFD
jgi:hypothetical protein